MKRFENKVVVVTGASQGLGYQVAKAYVAEGASVIMIARTEDKLNKAASSISEDKAFPFPMDVAIEANWVKLIAFIKEKFGMIDILVNCAALYTNDNNILQCSYDYFQYINSVNLGGTFLGMKYCYEVMKKDCYSSIVNISSIGGLKGGPMSGNDSAYQASKAAVRNLTKHAAYVFAPDKIRVVSVHPAGINTPMREQTIKEHPELLERAASRSPLPPHVAEPEDLAQIILFLTTQEAKSIDGSEILCECGQMAI